MLNAVYDVFLNALYDTAHDTSRHLTVDTSHDTSPCLAKSGAIHLRRRRRGSEVAAQDGSFTRCGVESDPNPELEVKHVCHNARLRKSLRDYNLAGALPLLTVS